MCNAASGCLVKTSNKHSFIHYNPLTSKSVRNWCMGRDFCSRNHKLNVLVQEHTSQYSAAVEALQTFTERRFSIQEWQQALSCAVHFIAKSKAIRNMCMRHYLSTCAMLLITDNSRLTEYIHIFMTFSMQLAHPLMLCCTVSLILIAWQLCSRICVT